MSYEMHITVWVPPELHARLVAEAEKRLTTLEAVAEDILDEHCPKQAAAPEDK